MQAAPLGFDWGSWYGIVLAVAAGITTIGGAVYLIARATRSVHRWLHPPKPLVAFSHPQEDSFAFVWFVGGDDSEMDRQDREHEEMRLSSLSVSYLSENKDSTAVLELSTGIRTQDGQEHTFESCFVQILAPGQHVDVPNMLIPAELCEA